MARREEEATVIRGSGNAFQDLGLADAGELLAKAKLARAIASHVSSRKMTQAELARLSGISQPKISGLLKGRISGFSSDRLMHILLKLDQDVTIVLRPKPEDRPAQVSVEMLGAL